MRKKLLSVFAIAVVAIVVLCVLTLQNRNSNDNEQASDDASNSEKLVENEQNDDDILTVSIETNEDFFEQAKGRTVLEDEMTTTYLELTVTMNAGIELTINPDTMEDKQVYEPYILNVPDELNGEKVVRFGISNDDYVNEIQIPSGCQDISVFECSSIEKVILSDSMFTTNISSCAELKEIVFPEDCYYPEINMTFRGLASLTQITLPLSVKYVAYSFALGMDSLIDVELNEGLQGICASFQGCNALESIDIPSSVTTIKECSFLNCEVLKEITLHDGLETISDSFTNCPALETLDIPDSVTLIDGESFTGCDNLTLIVSHDTAAEEYAIENDIPYQYRDE